MCFTLLYIYHIGLVPCGKAIHVRGALSGCVNSLRKQNDRYGWELMTRISHPSSDLCTSSRLTNALNMNSARSPIKFSQPTNQPDYTYTV